MIVFFARLVTAFVVAISLDFLLLPMLYPSTITETLTALLALYLWDVVSWAGRQIIVTDHEGTFPTPAP